PDTELWRRAAGYNMEGRHIDSTDVLASAAAFADAVDTVRTSGRPMLVEAHTLRLRGHAAYDTCDYLTADETAAFFAADPLPTVPAQLVASGHEAALVALETELNAFIEACFKTSLSVARRTADVVTLMADVFAPAAAPIDWSDAPAAPEKLNA